MINSVQFVQEKTKENGLSAKRILVVDDEVAVREVVTICLQRLGGWEVLTAVSGQDALHQACTIVPDAIVLDIMMPEMDGLTLLQHLHTNPNTQQIPVILLSVDSYLPQLNTLKTLGVVATVFKPFLPLDLVQQIAQAMKW